MRSKFLAALLCGFVVTSAHAQVFYPQSAMLDNGMQIVVLSNHRAPVITEMVWIKAGAKDDPWGKSGAAHFLEHLMFKGTKNRKDGEYSRLISERGGTENAFTTQDYTAYYASIGKEHLKLVAELEADRLASWQVNDAQVAGERDVILKERQQNTDNQPVALFFEQVNAVSYPNHPYQRPVIGWRSEMETLDRTTEENFFRTHYRPEHMAWVVSGDVTLDEIMPLAKATFGKLSRGKDTPHVLPQAQPLRAPINLHETSKLAKESLWSWQVSAQPARPDTIKQSDALLVLAKIFGDGRTGRLYRRLVVQDKIASSAGASYDPLAVGPTHFSIGITPHPDVAVEKIEHAVQEEIALLLKKGVTAAEVKNATDALQIDAVYARDSVTYPAMAVGQALMSGLDLKTIEAWPQRMQDVTQKDIAAAAQTVFGAEAPKPVTALLQPEVQK